jgi:hypothetical protein
MNPLLTRYGKLVQIEPKTREAISDSAEALREGLSRGELVYGWSRLGCEILSRRIALNFMQSKASTQASVEVPTFALRPL